MRVLVASRNYAEASRDLAHQIIARFGSYPGLIDDLTIGCKRVPHAARTTSGFALYAHPKQWCGDIGELLVAYFGDVPEPVNADHE
jgi:hypothetical protein